MAVFLLNVFTVFLGFLWFNIGFLFFFLFSLADYTKTPFAKFVVIAIVTVSVQIFVYLFAAVSFRHIWDLLHYSSI